MFVCVCYCVCYFINCRHAFQHEDVNIEEGVAQPGNIFSWNSAKTLISRLIPLFHFLFLELFCRLERRYSAQVCVAGADKNHGGSGGRSLQLCLHVWPPSWIGRAALPAGMLGEWKPFSAGWAVTVLALTSALDQRGSLVGAWWDGAVYLK